MAIRYYFVVDSKVHGYHVYKEIWPNPIIGEELPCEREIGNTHDPSAVAVKKLITGERKIVGHVPRRISPLSSSFIRGGGNIKCVVTGMKRYSSDLPQGGLEVPCRYTFSVNDAKKCDQLHKRIIDSLSRTCHDESPSTDVVEAIETRIDEIVDTNEPTSSGEKTTLIKIEPENTSNTSAMSNRICQDSHVEEVIVPEEVVCSPPKKQARFDEERLLMGEELSDREINFAQQLLKQQFDHINGLCSTLLQDKDRPYNLTTTTLSNRIQIIYCPSRRHWIVATTINSNCDTVKVYNSMFRYLDKNSLITVEKCFTYNGEVPTVKMMQCRKQEGTKDCGVYAVAFGVALAMGHNPSRQNLKQDVMRSHLVTCFKNEHFSLFPCK